MALTELYSFSQTVSTTELSISNGTSTLATRTGAGFFAVVLDTSAVAAGDEFEVKLYEKATSGGTQREVWRASITQSTGAIFMSPAFPLIHGWDFSIIRIAGTNRAITGGIRQG